MTIHVKLGNENYLVGILEVREGMEPLEEAKYKHILGAKIVEVSGGRREDRAFSITVKNEQGEEYEISTYRDYEGGTDLDIERIGGDNG